MNNSAADEAGLRQGDVVVQVDDEDVNKASQLQAKIATHRPGDEVTLKVYRDNELITLETTLKNREGTVGKKAKAHRGLSSTLGAEFSTVSKETAEELGIHGGVRVDRLYAGKLTRQTQMREGFIITRVNDQKVSSVDEFASIVENRKGGVYLEGVYPNIEGTFYYAFGM
jgi:S1-C subfamily serine protease